MAENCANLSDCIGDVWACLTVGVCARTNRPFVTTSLPVKSDSRCTYLAIGICNKCGRAHDGRMPPLDRATSLARTPGVGEDQPTNKGEAFRQWQCHPVFPHAGALGHFDAGWNAARTCGVPVTKTTDGGQHG